MRNTVLYGLVTGLAGLVFYVFFAFIAEHTNSIVWAFLICGAIAAATFVTYIVTRWYLSEYLAKNVVEKLKHLAQDNRLLEGGDRPFTADDINKLLNDLKAAAPGGFKLLQLALTIAFLSIMSLEVVALASAAVSYLQAQRLTQQNELIRAQKQVEEANFVRTSAEIAEKLSKTGLEAITQSKSEIEGSFVSEFTILSEFVSSVTGEDGAAGRIDVADFRVDVCPGGGTACDAANFMEFFSSALSSGEFTVTAENKEFIAAVYRLTRATEIMVQPFILVSGGDASFNDTIAKRGAQLQQAAINCGLDDESSIQLKELWSGFGSAGLASIDMWKNIDSVIGIQPGMKFSWSDEREKANFLGFAAAIQVMKEAIGGGKGEIATVSEGALVLQQTLQMLQSGITELMEKCSSQEASIAESMVEARRSLELVTRMGSIIIRRMEQELSQIEGE